jgi:hypothetical protein
VDKSTGLRFDQTVVTVSFYAQRDYPDPLRRIGYCDPKRVHLDIVLTIMGKTVPHRQKEMKRSCHEKRSEAVGQLGRRGTGSGG